MAVSTLSTCNFTCTTQYNASKTVSGQVNPIRSQSDSTGANINFQLGSTANKINEPIQVVRTLAGGATEDIDLRATLADVCNQTGIVLTEIKVLIVELLTTTAATSITIGGAASNPWEGAAAPLAAGSTINIFNGGGVAFWNPSADGFTVGGSSKVLTVLNNDGAVTATYRLTIFGCDS